MGGVTEGREGSTQGDRPYTLRGIRCDRRIDAMNTTRGGVTEGREGSEGGTGYRRARSQRRGTVGCVEDFACGQAKSSTRCSCAGWAPRCASASTGLIVVSPSSACQARTVVRPSVWSVWSVPLCTPGHGAGGSLAEAPRTQRSNHQAHGAAPRARRSFRRALRSAMIHPVQRASGDRHWPRIVSDSG